MACIRTFIQIILSSNQILLTYIAYLISVVSYQCLKRDSITYLKRALLIPLLPHKKGRRCACSPLLPLRRPLRSILHILTAQHIKNVWMYHSQKIVRNFFGFCDFRGLVGDMCDHCDFFTRCTIFLPNDMPQT